MILRLRRGLCRDEGSAPVEFVLVAPLVLLIFAAIIQIGLAGHVRATLVSSAAEGARVGAQSGSTRSAAIRETRSAVSQSIADGVVQDIKVTEHREGGMTIVVVDIEARLPLIGLLGPTALHVTGRALKEGV